MARYSDILRNQFGGPIEEALVSVARSDGLAVVLTADDGSTLDNPLTTDEYGAYYFNAPANFYDLKYYLGSRLVSEVLGLEVGVASLPTGSIVDALGTSTTLAPSQRVVTDALALTTPVTLAGGVARTAQAKMGDIVSVKDFGAIGDGTANDAAAFQAAINYCNTLGGGCVYVPNGKYKIGSSLTMKQKVTIAGAGVDSTIFIPAFPGNLFLIDLTALTPVAGFPDASVYWRDFTIDCVAQTGVTGIKLVQCRTSEIANIKFKGCVNNWYIDRGRDHSIHSIWSEGTTTLKMGGFVMTSTDDADYVFESHISDVHFFNNYVTGTQPTLCYVRRGALILLDKISLNDGFQGNATAANAFFLDNDCQGCKISNSIVAAVDVGIFLRPGTGPSVGPTFCAFTAVDIDQARNAAVIVDQASLNSFTNCNLSSSGVATTITALIIRNNSGLNSFKGGSIFGYNGLGGKAIDLTGSSGSTISTNISTCTNGVAIGVPCTSTSIHDCIFAGVATPIGGTPAQVGNAIKNNIGHRLQANLAPAFPATGVTVTNNKGYAVSAYITGGTVTGILVNGLGLVGLTSGQVRLEPGDSIAINYTGTPVWTWIASWG